MKTMSKCSDEQLVVSPINSKRVFEETLSRAESPPGLDQSPGKYSLRSFKKPIKIKFEAPHAREVYQSPRGPRFPSRAGFMSPRASLNKPIFQYLKPKILGPEKKKKIKSYDARISLPEHSNSMKHPIPGVPIEESYSQTMKNFITLIPLAKTPSLPAPSSTPSRPLKSFLRVDSPLKNKVFHRIVPSGKFKDGTSQGSVRSCLKAMPVTASQKSIQLKGLNTNPGSTKKVTFNMR